MTGTARLISYAFIFISALTFIGCQTQSGETATATTSSEASSAEPKIVFVRLDSLQNGYTELVIELERLQDNARTRSNAER